MVMQLSLGRRGKLLILGVGLVIIISVLLIAARSMLRRPPTSNELRLRHLDYMVAVLESYAERHGAYPQPTVRNETPEGIQHVWGYETDKPSLASCTVALTQEKLPDPAGSHCGGNIFDAQGNIIGWKGTITPESAMNTIDVAEKKGKGRISNPVSAFVQSIPFDPAYGEQSTLLASGFGEYIYAVRIPKDGAKAKGGTQYQLAVTLQNPDTGVLTTHIRGNFFVPSEERDQYPGSLIGPGILMDAFGNPVHGQSKALHVLIDQQQEGFPNPALGNGTQTLQRLGLERRMQRLSAAVGDRLKIATMLSVSGSSGALQSSLSTLHDDVTTMLTAFAKGETEGGMNLETAEVELSEHASALEEVMQTFLIAKSEEVGKVLELEVNTHDKALTILSDALKVALEAENSVLEARDEVLKYLDGEGIEEQSRNRAGRKLQSVLDRIPNLPSLFIAAKLPFPAPFLSKKQQDVLNILAIDEGADPKRMTDEGKKNEAGKTMVGISTIASELVIHLSELTQIVSGIQKNLKNNAVTAEEIDESLRKLSKALNEENERLTALFDSLAPSDGIATLLTLFQEKSADDPTGVLADVAKRLQLHGNFATLLFSPALLDAVILKQSPGVPDLDMFENRLDARYKGIPYPLP